VDQRKFDPYLFNPDHPANQGKAKGWRDVFGIGMGDGPLLDRLIREQLDRAQIEERGTVVVSGESVRAWELVIPEFVGTKNDNVSPVVTAWAHEPGNEKPHLVTAYVRTI
jgi:hypothetical protein